MRGTKGLSEMPLGYQFLTGGAGVVGSLGRALVVGQSFAFLKPGWGDTPLLRSILQAAGVEEAEAKVFSLWGHGTLQLPGVKVQKRAVPRAGFCSVWTDQTVYREGRDAIRIFVFDPLASAAKIEVDLKEHGRSVGKQSLNLDERGIGMSGLSGLPAGKFSLEVAGGKATTEFSVARPKLTMVEATWLQQYTQETGRKNPVLVFVLQVESFGAPLRGDVGINVIDEGQTPPRPMAGNVFRADGGGRIAGELSLIGKGPFSVEIQSLVDQEKRVFLPLSAGSASKPAVEDEPFVISPLGRVKTWLWEGGAAEGLGWQEKTMDLEMETPILVERTAGEEAILRATKAFGEGMVVSLDPLRGGIKRHEWKSLAIGEEVKLALPSPLAMLTIGGFVEGKPWEGWSVLAKAPESPLRLSYPKKIEPGTAIDLIVETGEEALTPVYISIREEEENPKDRTAWGPARSFQEALRPLLGGLRVGQADTLLIQAGEEQTHLKDEDSEGSKAQEILPFPDGWTPPVPTRESFGKTLFAGIVPVEGRHSLRVEIGDEQARYRVEALRLDGMLWRYASGSLHAETGTFVEMLFPHASHETDAVVGEIVISTKEPKIRVSLSCEGRDLPLSRADRTPIREGEALEGGLLHLHSPVVPGIMHLRVGHADGTLIDDVSTLVEAWGNRRGLRTPIRLVSEGQRFDAKQAGMEKVHPLGSLGNLIEMIAQPLLQPSEPTCETVAAAIRAAAALVETADEGYKVEEALQAMRGNASIFHKMMIPGRGLLLRPEGEPAQDLGEEAIAHLWEAALLRRMLGQESRGSGWQEAIVEMAEEAAKGIRLPRLPERIRSCREAFRVWMLDATPQRRQEALWEVQKRLQEEQGRLRIDAEHAIQSRQEAAYAAALLWLQDDPTMKSQALQLANRLLARLDADLRLHSGLEIVSLLTMLLTFQSRWPSAEETTIAMDDEILPWASLPAHLPIDDLQVIKGAAALVGRSRYSTPLSSFTEPIPWEIYLHQGTTPLGRGDIAEVELGDRITLTVQLSQRPRPGDQLEVFLPPALAWLKGTRDEKVLSFPLQSETSLSIEIVAVATTLTFQGEIGSQHWGLRLWNPYREERGQGSFERLIIVWPFGKRRKAGTSWFGGIRRKIFG